MSGNPARIRFKPALPTDVSTHRFEDDVGSVDGGLDGDPPTGERFVSIPEPTDADDPVVWHIITTIACRYDEY